MSASESADHCTDWTRNGKSNSTTADRAKNPIFGFRLTPLFWRQRRAGFSIPSSRGSRGLAALVEVAVNAGRLKIVEVVCPALGARHRMVNVPCTPLSWLTVIFPGQLPLTKVAVAARAAVNPI